MLEDSSKPVSFLRRLVVVWAGAVLGTAFVLPYAFHIQAAVVAEVLAQSGLPLWALAAVSLVQTGLLAAAGAALGLLAGRAAGLRTPVLDTWLSGRSAGWRWLSLPVVLGLLVGLTILVGDVHVVAPLLGV